MTLHQYLCFAILGLFFLACTPKKEQVNAKILYPELKGVLSKAKSFEDTLLILYQFNQFYNANINNLADKKSPLNKKILLNDTILAKLHTKYKEKLFRNLDSLYLLKDCYLDKSPPHCLFVKLGKNLYSVSGSNILVFNDAIDMVFHLDNILPCECVNRHCGKIRQFGCIDEHYNLKKAVQFFNKKGKELDCKVKFVTNFERKNPLCFKAEVTKVLYYSDISLKTYDDYIQILEQIKPVTVFEKTQACLNDTFSVSSSQELPWTDLYTP